MSAKRVYGIDLGTTYSCIAHVDEHGKPVVIPNSEGDLTTPSVVYFESTDNVVVGQSAKAFVSINSDLCVSMVKRSMGNPAWEKECHGHVYKPQDISSFILRKVVGDVEKITGEKIEDVVITCPAYFGINEREATKQAGVLAGLNVLQVIPEPTAAALAYGIEQTEDQVVLVYDLGGGTFDVTLIEVKAGEITVICTGGDHELGGKDWDDSIVRYFTQKFEDATGIPADDLLENQETYQELLSAAERQKKMLSSCKVVTENVRFDGKQVKVELTRETFDQITNSHLGLTLSLMDQEIGKARERGYTKIDKLLLVGGSTYMPQIMEAVEKKHECVRRFDPNQAVAKGAALYGYKFYLDEEIRIRVADQIGQQAGEVDLGKVSEAVVEKAQKQVALEHGLTLPAVKAIANKKITNVTSKSFGIVVMNEQGQEVVTNLIEINDQVPKSMTKRYGTYQDGQEQVDLRCMENKLSGVNELELNACKELGTAILRFTHALPCNSPVEITFVLGPDGLLKLHGRDLTTGEEIDTKFETESIMSHEKVEESKSHNLALQVA